MKLNPDLRHQVVITSGDSPQLIYDALHELPPYYNNQAEAGQLTSEAAWRFGKRANDAWECLQTLEGVDGIEEGYGQKETPVRLSLDEIETALTVSGEKKIYTEPESVAEIDVLLRSIDRLKTET